MMREAPEPIWKFLARVTLRTARPLVVLAVISGCSVTPRAVDAPVRDAAAINEWQAAGRIAVSGANTGGSGSFTWSQQGAQSQIHIRGPVGIGSLRLTVSDQNMRIETADGQILEADEAQSELSARLGAYVPARDLRYWLVGLAAPGEHQWTNSESTTLTQRDWHIEYQRFGVTDGVRLPLKLVAISGPAKVRIVIDRWKVNR